MPDYCCVPGCKNRGSGHRFPKDLHMKKLWCIAIKRVDPTTGGIWSPSSKHVVCRSHFSPEDYTNTLLEERRRLKNTAVPKLYIADPLNVSNRRKRFESRLSSIRQPDGKKKKVKSADQKGSEPAMLSDIHVGAEEIVSTTETDTEERHSLDINSVPQLPVVKLRTVPTSEMSTQCGPDSSTTATIFSVHRFAKRPSVIKYYTGFDDYDHFIFFFNILGPASSHLGIHDIPTSPQDQLFLVLMKLRQAKDDFELGILFHIRPQAVSKVFSTWINFLYHQLQEFNIWPSQEVTRTYMPTHFAKLFPSTRVILDATEIPIQKPHPCGPQRETFSSYKNKNTLKVMVGCTPRGSVSYVSSAYGGSTSDRQITERSKLCADGTLFQPGDSIMADRGIMVQDLFASKDVYVNTPTMLKGKSQLEPEEIHRDRKVASKRIHIERVIGLAKTFKILKREILSNLITLGNRIIHVCFYLCNFKNSIVGQRS